MQETREHLYKLSETHSEVAVTLLRLLDRLNTLYMSKGSHWQKAEYPEGSLSQQLADLLVRESITQKQLADEMGCSQATISRILRGEPIGQRLHDRLVQAIGRIAVGKAR